MGSGHYVRLRTWIIACRPRGTALWIVPAQRVLSVRLRVLLAQLARSVQEAALLVNGRSAVRSRSPAPRSEAVSALWASRFVERMLLAALPSIAPSAVTDGGSGVDSGPQESSFDPDAGVAPM